MAITLADFTKIWASTSPLTPYSFSESNYKEGWNFIGGTPPSRQMWDSIQNQNDEKLKYIVDNFLPLDGGTMTGAIVLADGGNPLSTAGGTMTGSIQYINNGKVFAIGNTITGNVDLGWSWDNREGAGLGLRSTDFSNPGEFTLFARDSANSRSLIGKPDGSLTWDSKEVERVNAKGTDYIRYESGLQICWGEISVTGGTAHSSSHCNFPVSFVNTSYTIQFSGAWVASVNEYMRIESKGTTYFVYSILTPSSNSHAWYWCAVGYWK